MTAQDLTYPEVGATRDGARPAGYTHVSRDVPLGRGDAAWALATNGLMTFEMHRLAGLRPKTSAPRAAVGVEVTSHFGLGPLALPAPTRIVWAADDPDLAGFGYGTLPGHPESGEEAFFVTRDADGTVRFEVRAFSRPARWFTKAAGPLMRLTVTYINRRYVAAMRTIVGRAG